MFGGIGTIVLIVVMRVLVARAWRDGIGLTLSRRLAIPLVALAIGLFVLRKSAAEVFGTHLVLVVVIALAVTMAGGVFRANTVRYSLVAPAKEYPGGIRIQARPTTLTADVIAVLAAAAVIFSLIAPVAGLSAAGGSLTVVVALGDIVASGLLVLRGRPATLRPANSDNTAAHGPVSSAHEFPKA